MSNRKKKKVVKLQNETNQGLFELEDNIKRDYKKVQAVHRISPADEAAIYKKIGYKSRSVSWKPKVDEEILAKEVLRPVTAEDIEDEDISSQPVINTASAVTKSLNSKKKNNDDILSSSGIG